LGSHSDLVITTGKIEEIGPLGLAPTTSTTVMMALGDALAMSLMVLRGFSREDFARYHPGGDLGRALLTVSQIMRHGDSHCVVNKSEITKDVVHKITLTKGRPGAAAVVNDSGHLVGIFTDGELRRCLEGGVAFLGRPIEEVMAHKPKKILSSKLAQEASRIMQEIQIDQIIVVDNDDTPVGLVDVQDLLAHGIR